MATETLYLMDAQAYSNRGVAYVNEQQYDEAIADFTKAQGLGWQIDSGFLKYLREASGRKK